MKRSMETTCIQGGWQPKNGEPRILPIYQSTTFKYSTSEQMGRLFDLEENGYAGYTVHFEEFGADGRFEHLPFLAASRLMADGNG